MRVEKFVYIEKSFVYFAPGGASNVQPSKVESRSHQKYIGEFWANTLATAAKALHYFRRLVLGKNGFSGRIKRSVFNISMHRKTYAIIRSHQYF